MSATDSPVSQPSTARRLGVLISGRGSNLQALIAAIACGELDARIVVVISNRADAGGLDLARGAGIETLAISHRDFATRDDFDARLAQELRDRQVGLVCLAGFMRLVGARLLDAFPNAVLNIHPSLLPAFPGVEAQHQALRHGVKVTGVTEDGPIVVQACVPVLDSDTIATLSARILVEEHRIYPEAVGMVLGGRRRVDGRRFTITD